MARLMMLWLVLAATVAAQTPYKTAADVTVSSTAVSLFTSTDVQAGNGHAQATGASCSLTGGNIRVSWDGVDPTTDFGEVILAGGPYAVRADILLTMRGIRDASTDGVWSCSIDYTGGR